MKRWTKKEFLEIVKPCGYKWRIWWFFIWHRQVTLLDVLDADWVEYHDKLHAFITLDRKWYEKTRLPYGTNKKERLAHRRAELEGVG